MQHFGDRLDELLDHVSIPLFVDVNHFLVGGGEGQGDDQLLISLGIFVQLVAEQVVVILSLLVQQVEQLVRFGHRPTLLDLVPPKQLVELLFQVLLVPVHSLICVLVDYHCLVELLLELQEILRSVHLLVLVVCDLLDQRKYHVRRCLLLQCPESQ